VKNSRPTILAIDTSCDETSAAVVQGVNILANLLPSQNEYHEKYGGVVPSLAKFAHQERIDNVIAQAINESGVEKEKLDAIAVTQGPGLAIALEVGIKKAKEMAQELKIPLIPINHMEGHLLSSLAKLSKNDFEESLENVEKEIKSNLPIIGLLVSGGHTELILVTDLFEYEKLGQTLDDSCGEAFDKAARMLGLGFPGGPEISRQAEQGRGDMILQIMRMSNNTILTGINKTSGKKYELPIPMIHSGNLNFSYSGLKTAFKYLINSIADSDITLEKELRKDTGLNEATVKDLSVMFETAAIQQIILKLNKTIEKIMPKEIWIGGGVAANPYLREQLTILSQGKKINIRLPESKNLTTDNAAMIGVAGSLRFFKDNFSRSDFDRLPRYSIDKIS
jgi:N6-L-threonylcarbamoyladenine synthase